MHFEKYEIILENMRTFAIFKFISNFGKFPSQNIFFCNDLNFLFPISVVIHVVGRLALWG